MFLEALNFNQLHCTLLVLEFHCIRVIRFIRHCTVFFGARKRRIGLGKPYGGRKKELFVFSGPATKDGGGG